MVSHADRLVAEDAHLSNIKSRHRRRGVLNGNSHWVRMCDEGGQRERNRRVIPAIAPRKGTVHTAVVGPLTRFIRPFAERSIDTANDHRHKTESQVICEFAEMPPPLPAAPKRPGRVKVYGVLDPYIPEDNNGKELRVEEGDVLYISEGDANDDFFEATCGEKTGRLPASYVTSEKVLTVEFPLHEAAKRGNLAFLLDCLRHKVSPNSLDRSGSTALHWASHGGHVSVLTELLKIPGLSMSSQNKLGDTPLHAASWKGHLECVKLLVDHDADVHVRNLEGKKPVDLAATPDIGAFLQVTMSKVAEPADLEDYGSSDDEESPQN